MSNAALKVTPIVFIAYVLLLVYAFNQYKLEIIKQEKSYAKGIVYSLSCKNHGSVNFKYVVNEREYVYSGIGCLKKACKETLIGESAEIIYAASKPKYAACIESEVESANFKKVYFLGVLILATAVAAVYVIKKLENERR